MPTLSPAKNLHLLLHDVARLLRRTIDQRAQAIGLTSAQWRVLALIARAEAFNQEPLSQAALADQMDMEPITLSRHIDRMQSSGLIERRPNPTDRRAYHLFLTDEARPLVTQFREIGTECINAALAGIGEEEIDHVTDVLARMRSNIVSKPKHRDGDIAELQGRVA
jgi:DNA-binding MarR family transcriptional regulator